MEKAYGKSLWKLQSDSNTSSTESHTSRHKTLFQNSELFLQLVFILFTFLHVQLARIPSRNFSFSASLLRLVTRMTYENRLAMSVNFKCSPLILQFSQNSNRGPRWCPWYVRNSKEIHPSVMLVWATGLDNLRGPASISAFQIVPSRILSSTSKLAFACCVYPSAG